MKLANTDRSQMTAVARRLDRESWYLWVHLGVLIGGCGILLRTRPASSLARILPATNDLLGITMVTGSSLALIGSVIGTRWFVIHSTDLRLPYAFGFLGCFAVLNSVLVYIVIIHSVLWGTLGGGLGIVASLACIQSMWAYARDIYLRTKILQATDDD